MRKLVCRLAPRPSSKAATATFTESTNLSIPLNKKHSNLSEPETSDLSEPANKPTIIVVKDSLQEKSWKDPLNESQTSALNQPRAGLPRSKTTFEEEWKSESKQVEEYELKCQQPIHLSASLQVSYQPLTFPVTRFFPQGRVRKLEDVE